MSLREDLALKFLADQGAVSVARERFEAATRTTEALLDHMRTHRVLLNDLRASLRQLRSSLAAHDLLPRRQVSEPRR